MLLAHSSTALKGDLCGVGLFLLCACPRARSLARDLVPDARKRDLSALFEMMSRG